MPFWNFLPLPINAMQIPRDHNKIFCKANTDDDMWHAKPTLTFLAKMQDSDDGNIPETGH